MKTPLTLISEAIKALISDIKIYASIALVASAVTTIILLATNTSPDAFEGESLPTVTEGAVLFIIMLFMLYINLAVLRAVTMSPKQNIEEIFRYALNNYGRFLMLSVLLFLIIVAGFVLFIVPGLYLGVALSFATVVFVVEGQGGTSALSRSRAIVRGRWFSVLGYYLFLIVLGIALSIVSSFLFAPAYGSYIFSFVSSFANVLISTVCTAYTYYLYTELTSTGVIQATPSSVDPQTQVQNQS